MPAQLVALTDGPSILLDKPILLLGRHPECDIQIDSRKVSRRHCCIAQVHDYLVVRDLGSTNGIRINGVRVMEGRIKPGDELTIGSHRYQVRWDAAAAAPMPPKVEARKATAQADRIGALDDDDLEAYDEPVPIAESPELSPPLPARPAVLVAPPVGGAPRVEEDPSPPPKPSSLVIPENLELMPASDSHFPAPAPGSHHPA
jgi:predicted component of type VI protein secretion system